MNMLNATEIFILLGGLVALLGLILSAYGIITWVKRAGRLTTRMDQYVAPPLQTVDPKASPIIPREISGSLLSRTIGNALRKMGNFLGRFAPKNMLERMEHQLTIADYPNNLHAGGFFALRVLLLGAGLVLAYFINRDLESLNTTNLLLSLLLVIMFWMLPSVWLRGKGPCPPGGGPARPAGCAGYALGVRQRRLGLRPVYSAHQRVLGYRVRP
jgi:hypothetical protein